MNIKQLAPWNWFHKEQNESQQIPIKNQNLSQPVESLSLPLNTVAAREFTNLFNQLSQWFHPSYSPTTSVSLPLSPNLDITESAEAYEIALEVPGTEKEDINISVLDDSLVIEGEKNQSEEEKRGNYHYIGRSYGSFRRVLALPVNISEKDIRANLKDGILTIAILKQGEIDANAHKVAIN